MGRTAKRTRKANRRKAYERTRRSTS